jgi:hypothetical protein
LLLGIVTLGAQQPAPFTAKNNKGVAVRARKAR